MRRDSKGSIGLRAARPRPGERDSPSEPRRLRVSVLYQPTAAVHRGFPSDALPDMNEAAIAPVVEALTVLGHQVTSHAVSYDDLEELVTLDTDLAFNLCEGCGTDGLVGAEVPALLAQRGLPYTGVGPGCYLLTSDKACMRARLRAAGVRIAAGQVMAIPGTPRDPALRFPLFVKPRHGAASQGIDPTSVVRDEAELRAAVTRVIGEYEADVIVEEYIDGREITVGVLGVGRLGRVLAPLEVRFGPAYDGLPRIRTMASKHDPTSPLYWGFETVCPASLSGPEERRVRQAALRAYAAVGGDGYGRVDLRLTPQGVPYVLEVNANPSLESGPAAADCGLLVLIARAHGWDLPALLARIVEIALSRIGVRRPAVVPAAASRWRPGRGLSVHALRPLAAGVIALPFGAPPPAPGGTPLVRRRTDRRAVLADPSVRHVRHGAAPNVVALRSRRGTLAYHTLRPIARGEELLADHTARIDGTPGAGRLTGSPGEKTAEKPRPSRTE